MEDQNFEHSPVRVKHEPLVEYVLILPRPTIGWPAIKQEEDVKLKWVKSVQLTKFNTKWPGSAKFFKTFFTCQHCQLVVRSHLSLHLKACSKLNPARFECDVCGEIFQKKSRMSQHMTKHSSERNFRCTCTKCGSGFKSYYELLMHKKNHDKSCETCQTCYIIEPSSDATQTRNVLNGSWPDFRLRQMLQIVLKSELFESASKRSSRRKWSQMRSL